MFNKRELNPSQKIALWNRVTNDKLGWTWWKVSQISGCWIYWVDLGGIIISIWNIRSFWDDTPTLAKLEWRPVSTTSTLFPVQNMQTNSSNEPKKNVSHCNHFPIFPLAARHRYQKGTGELAHPWNIVVKISLGKQCCSPNYWPLEQFMIFWIMKKNEMQW